MAGTISLSLSQQFDMDGVPLSGGRLFFFVATTTAPQDSFQDFGLTIINPNPLVLDASGRVPIFYLADGFIKIRLEDKDGVVVIAADQLLVVGPSLGTSTGTSGTDVTAVLAPGDIKARFGVGALEGFVRCNGLTIGNTGSGATEAPLGPKAEALFKYLHANTTLPIFTSSGATSTRVSPDGDWTALKQMGLPDLRGRAIAGMDDMGATAAGRLTSAGFGASGIVLGNVGGTETKTLTTAQLPSHSHANSLNDPTHSHGINISDPGHTHVVIDPTHAHSVFAVGAAGGFTGGGAGVVQSGTTTTSGAFTGITNQAAATSISSSANFAATNMTISNANAGSGNAHSVVAPTIVITFYMKL